MAWGFGKNGAVLIDTVKHQIRASDIAYYGQPFPMIRGAHKDWGLTCERQEVTNFTADNWLLAGACYKPHDKGPHEDPLLVDLYRAGDLPEGEGCGVLTAAVKFAGEGGFKHVRLSEIKAFIKEHDLDRDILPMSADADKRALAAVRAA